MPLTTSRLKGSGWPRMDPKTQSARSPPVSVPDQVKAMLQGLSWWDNPPEGCCSSWWEPGVAGRKAVCPAVALGKVTLHCCIPAASACEACRSVAISWSLGSCSFLCRWLGITLRSLCFPDFVQFPF